MTLCVEDDTNLSLSENAKLEIDEYVFDPNNDPGETRVSWLRKLFVFTSGLIGRDEPADVEQVYTGCICIRGSAENIIREQVLNNPTPELGEVGIWLETASPMSVSTFVDTPGGPFTLRFDYFFLDAGGELTVSLAGAAILSLQADPATLGQRQSIELDLDWEAMTTELVFTIDGPSEGLSAIISNLEVPTASISNLDGWFAEGGGRVEFVYMATTEQLDQLFELATASVPLPAWHLYGVAAGLLGASLFVGARRLRRA